MIIKGRKVYTDIKPVDDKYLICEFSEGLTQESIIEHQYRMIYSEQIFNIVEKCINQQNILDVVANLEELHKVYKQYQHAEYSAKRNAK